MKKRSIRFAGAILLFLLSFTGGVTRAADPEIPTVLYCTVNARAERDFDFSERRWEPESGLFGRPFTVTTKTTSYGPFREKIFSGLDTPRPTIRSITPKTHLAEETAVEFSGTIVSREADTLFVMWRNPHGNKVWLAAVNVAHKKATLSHAFRGLTSVGVETETLDCH